MSRWVLVGWVAPLGACASFAGGAPEGDPTGNCEWRVCVDAIPQDGGIEVWARNGGPIPATVTLAFDELRNVSVTDGLPIVRVVPPKRRVRLTRLRRADADATLGAHPIVSIDLGSDGTRPDESVLYSAPFGGARPRRLIAGYGSPTHQEANEYAVDFGMPEGTPVLAARAGIVVHVQDGFRDGALTRELLERANLVAIAHVDGTLASYGHLFRGIKVAEGDTVVTGQLLGYSGSTGFSGQPHLHFHVGKRLMGGDNRTIPIRLRGPDGGALEPVEGAWYEPALESAPGGPSGRRRDRAGPRTQRRWRG